MTAPHWLSRSEAARAFAARTLSPVELLTALLARIDALEPKLHAFIRLDAEAAMERRARRRGGDRRRAHRAARCTASRSA